MNFKTENTEEILDNLIGGFRRYTLGETARLTYVSANLCRMVGYGREELDLSLTDAFATLVHPADREIYSAHLGSLATDGSATAEYRVVKKDGTVICVCDTLTAKADGDGTLLGFSTLADITAIRQETDSLRFLNDTVPCGMLKYTCERTPKVTYLNDNMKRILRLPEIKDGEMDYLDMYKDNVYLMIPMEERPSFSAFLERVRADGAPHSGEINILRCDGMRARLYGWVTKVMQADGTEEFQSVCIDVTEKYRDKRASVADKYIGALSDVYDKIFEYDLENGTVKYIYGAPTDSFGGMMGVPMHMREATDQWIKSGVYPDDRKKTQEFFNGIFSQSFNTVNNLPPRISFRSVNALGEAIAYTGIFIKIDRHVNLFCCRRVQDQAETDFLRNENMSLKNMNETMREMVMRFTEGVYAFEVSGDKVTPMYASENICEFFGFSKDEWLSLMNQSSSIKEFVSRSGVGYEKFKELLDTGEAEFSYMDVHKGIKRRIKAICSQKSSDGDSSRYVMLYNLDRRESNVGIYVRTFGYFDVFIDDKPIAFRNKKAKELLALLVDRRGGYVSSEEAISFLWENEPVNAVTLARYRKEALRLKNTLEEYGIADIVESVDGKRRIVTEKIGCDLYDYLSRKDEYADLFKGSYLTNYSWGENTLGELMNRNLY